MKNLKSTFVIVLAASLITVTSTTFAGGKNKYKNKHYSNNSIIQHYDYAKVLKVKPIYRGVRSSVPVRECWDEPVVYSAGGYSQQKSTGSTLVGGVLGGVIGHQIGKGRGKKLATALGAIIGAGIGHNAVNGYESSNQGHSYTEYEEQCEVNHQVSYDKVVDGYDVTYRYQGESYHVEMPYRPGKRIKLRIDITPEV